MIEFIFNFLIENWLYVFAMFLSFLGNFIIVKKNWFGYVIWTCSNFVMIYLSVLRGDYGTVMFFCGYILLNVYGIYLWKYKT